MILRNRTQIIGCVRRGNCLLYSAVSFAFWRELLLYWILSLRVEMKLLGKAWEEIGAFFICPLREQESASPSGIYRNLRAA